MKDWTGNRRSAHAMIGSFVGAHSTREEHDYYATDPSVLASLLNQKELPHVVYECACGAGHLAEELAKHGHKVSHPYRHPSPPRGPLRYPPA